MSATDILKAARERQRGVVGSFESAASKAIGELSTDMGGVISGGGMGGMPIMRSTRGQLRESYSHFRNWVYVCVSAICTRLAGQPCGAGEVVNAPDNPERRIGGLINVKQPEMQSRIPPQLLQRGATDQELEVLPNHPVLDVLARPNPIQRKFEFLWFSGANLLLTGEAYWIGGVVKDKLELWAVPTSWIDPLHDQGPFSSYLLKTPGGAEPIPLPAENVARTYFPDPSDIKGALSPLRAIISAVRTDDRIQQSQEDMFARGIMPNLMVTVGRVRGSDGAMTDRRPRLTGRQRRQIITAVREIWRQTVAQGDPAILDGLIESVHKLSNTPQEMDWTKSGETVKRRIMQAYRVNPISVGEIVGSNRAQAVEAEKATCSQAVNPIGAAFSETATGFLGPWYDDPPRLKVWIEPCMPVDPDLELKRYSEGRKNQDVSRNEYRANILGLPPVEEETDDRSQLLETVGGMTGTVAIVNAISTGAMTPEQGSKALQLFLQISEEEANEIAGVGVERPQPPAPEPPAPPPPAEPADEIEPEGGDEGEVEEPLEDAEEAVRAAKSLSGKLTRGGLETIHKAKSANHREVVSRAMARFFPDDHEGDGVGDREAAGS